MVKAAITPSVVQKTYKQSTGSYGTPMRLVKYVFKVTKVTDGDWINTTTNFQTGTPLYYNAVTIDSSSDGVFEGTVELSYTDSGATATTYLSLSGGTTGTTYGEVWYEE